MEEKRKKILENDFSIKDYFDMLIAAMTVVLPVIFAIFGILYLVSRSFIR